MEDFVNMTEENFNQIQIYQNWKDMRSIYVFWFVCFFPLHI